MATTRRAYVFATFVLSCCAFALLVTALMTPHWIDAEADPGPSTKNYQINYGLWNGNEIAFLLESSPQTYDLTVVCIMDEGKCMFSMKTTPEARESEAKAIISGTAISSCVSGGAITTTTTTTTVTPDAANGLAGDIAVSDAVAFDADISISKMKYMNITSRADGEAQLLDAGIWISTILFLALAIVMSLVSALFSVLNTATNPVEQILSIFGLYIWNGISACSCLLVLFLWGINFAMNLSVNIATCNTLTKRASSEGLAAMGYSYWMVFVSLILFLVNIGLLYLRKFLLDRQPPPPTITIDDKSDGTIFLY